MLNADYSAICVSGFPIYKSRWNEGFPIDSVADMVSICDYREDMTFETAYKWDNSKYIPQIVIINLGTNDCSYFTEGQAWVDNLIKEKGSFDEALKDSYFQNELFNLGEKVKKFLDHLFTLYGKDLKIIWTLGVMYTQEHVNKVIENAIKEYNHSNVHYFTFNSPNMSNDFGANWHPGAMRHKNSALELVDFIKKHIL